MWKIVATLSLFLIFAEANETNHDDANCTPPAVDDFPSDGLTPHERRQGLIIIHVLIAIYVIGALAMVCDDYFVPVMHDFSERLKIPPDVAGATLMAFGTSCPELFVSLIGAFITEGDIGVGAVIGSAVFNVLAIASVCGLCAGTVVAVNWRPLTRDSIFYIIGVATLLYIIEDERIYWYEALVLVIEYFIYIIVMYLNTRFQKYCRGPLSAYDLSTPESTKPQFSSGSYIKKSPSIFTVSDLYKANIVFSQQLENEKFGQNTDPPFKYIDSRETSIITLKHSNSELLKNDSSDSSSKILEVDDGSSLWSMPKDCRIRQIAWFIWWPMKFLYKITIPDVREDCACILLVLTFLLSIAYIAVHSYIATWMVSIIGNTIKVPDSVMGLTFMAFGSSLPEVVSSIIVSRQSLGNMALSNAMGGNIFTLLLCLGAPWLVKGTVKTSELTRYVRIYSQGLTYSVLGLLLSVVVMLVVICASRFKLNKKSGVLFLFCYILYVVVSCMYEMNVFSQVNLPQCHLS